MLFSSFHWIGERKKEKKNSKKKQESIERKNNTISNGLRRFETSHGILFFIRWVNIIYDIRSHFEIHVFILYTFNAFINITFRCYIECVSSIIIITFSLKLKCCMINFQYNFIIEKSFKYRVWENESMTRQYLYHHIHILNIHTLQCVRIAVDRIEMKWKKKFTSTWILNMKLKISCVQCVVGCTFKMNI